MILIIQGATNHSSLNNHSGAKYKIFTLYHSNFSNFPYNNIPLFQKIGCWCNGIFCVEIRSRSIILENSRTWPDARYLGTRELLLPLAFGRASVSVFYF